MQLSGKHNPTKLAGMAILAVLSISGSSILHSQTTALPLLAAVSSSADAFPASAEPRYSLWAEPKAAAGRTHTQAAAPAKKQSTKDFLTGPNSSWNFFGADSRWYPYTQVSGNNLLPLKQGALVSATYYWDENVGLEVEGSFYSTTSNDGSSGGAMGPVYRFRKPLSPTIHALAGAQHFLGPIIPSYSGTGYYANAPIWAPTLSLGGSIDVPVPDTRGHLAVRVEASYQYLHGSYGPVYDNSVGGQMNINTYRLNPGLVFKFGRISHGYKTPKVKKKK